MRRRTALSLSFFLLVSACGPGAEGLRPTTPVSLPDAEAVRREAVDALGQRAWAAMSAGEPSRLLYTDRDLEVLVGGPALQRIAARRIAPGDSVEPARLRAALARASYAGICLQGARTEEVGGPLGLLAEGWVFDRLLIIGRQPNGRRVAAWLEGQFVYSDAGFAALDLERVEEPRWEHSDLEIAPCDVSIRNDLPEIAR